MQQELLKSFQNWDTNIGSRNSQLVQDEIDALVADFNAHVNDALSSSLKVSKKKSKSNQQQIRWDPKIFSLTCDENKAFCKYQHNANPSETLELRLSGRSVKIDLRMLFAVMSVTDSDLVLKN